MVGNTVTVRANSRRRQALSFVNSGPDPVLARDQATPAEAPNGVGVDFSSRKDVENLLGEKMKGKNKNDHKGSCEQMTEYIKKLRSCIKWYMDLEDGYLAEQEEQRNLMETEEKRHNEIESHLRDEIDDMERQAARESDEIESLNKQIKILNEQVNRLRQYNSEDRETISKLVKKNAALSDHVNLLKSELDSSRIQLLSDELERANIKIQRLNNQLKFVQEYNSMLQAHAKEDDETISNLLKKKTIIVENSSSLREHINLPKSQLDSKVVLEQSTVRELD